LADTAIDKVLMIAGHLETRGSVTYTFNLCKGLKARGCEPLVLCTGGPMLPAFEREGIRVACTDSLGKPVYDLFAFRRFLRSVGERFKVVHVQHKSHLRRGLRAARTLNLPAVLTIHHFFESGERLRVPRKCVRAVIAVSQAVREDLVNNAKIPRELIRVVSTGVDLEAAAACRKGRQRNEAPVIGTIGTLTPIKGNEYFLRAARAMLDRGVEAHFVVAGRGGESAQLRKLARELELTRDLTFVPDFSDNYEILRALDVFVNPSLREGLGLTVLQAMACGVPIVCAASGGIHSFVIDGETGLMVPQRDTGAIAAALVRLVEDKEFSHKLALNASDMVKREYPLDKMIDEMLDLYGEVVREWNEPATV
jgi:glycosyltransferase involved in cell wall biosynthesis